MDILLQGQQPLDAQPPELDAAECLQLLACLELALLKVEKRLRAEGFSKGIAQDATEWADSVATDAISTGVAQKMTSPARRKWLWLVARNRAVTLLRRRQSQSLPDDDLIPPRDSPWWEPYEIDILFMAVGQLPAEVQAVIQVFFFDGLTSRDAAIRLGVPESTARRRKEEAIRCLKAAFLRIAREA